MKTRDIGAWLLTLPESERFFDVSNYEEYEIEAPEKKSRPALYKAIFMRYQNRISEEYLMERIDLVAGDAESDKDKKKVFGTFRGDELLMYQKWCIVLVLVVNKQRLNKLRQSDLICKMARFIVRSPTYIETLLTNFNSWFYPEDYGVMEIERPLQLQHFEKMTTALAESFKQLTYGGIARPEGPRSGSSDDSFQIKLEELDNFAMSIVPTYAWMNNHAEDFCQMNEQIQQLFQEMWDRVYQQSATWRLGYLHRLRGTIQRVQVNFEEMASLGSRAAQIWLPEFEQIFANVDTLIKRAEQDLQAERKYAEQAEYEEQGSLRMENLQEETRIVNQNIEAMKRIFEVHVKKWDFSTKYGLGYLLSDDSTGVYFNDSTNLIIDKNGQNFQYIEKNQGDKADTITPYKMSDYPLERELQKKVTLLQHFKNYLYADTKIQADIKDVPSDSGYCYVKKWMKTKHAIIFKLSNKIVQVNFTDKTEIILSSEREVVTYTNLKGEKSEQPIATALDNKNEEMVMRLKYTKEILNHMLNGTNVPEDIN